MIFIDFYCIFKSVLVTKLISVLIQVAVADLPETRAWLNEKGLPHIAALTGACFGADAVGDPAELLIYRALVVQYDADAGLTHQEVHRDGSLVTPPPRNPIP